jgi:DNA invertase Pin-like site-specific DNA recombinase
MTAAVYIRVSSPKGQKTDSQRAELEAWIKRQRIKGTRWFEDRDSATNLQREAFRNCRPPSLQARLTRLWCGSSTAWPGI